MINKVTGERPQPITEDEVDLTHNTPAQELVEEVKRLTAEARESLLLQALTVSNEKCNDLVLKLNVRVAELTQQVKNVEGYNRLLEKKLKEDVENLLENVKERNYELTKKMEYSLNRITNIVTEIEKIVSITTERATDLATRRLKEGIDIAVENAKTKVDESVITLKEKVKEAESEIEKAKNAIHYERGVRKFMFWATPILLFVQGVMLAIALFG